MKILVTGAKGFVGQNLCAQLKNIAEGKAKWYDLQAEGLEVFQYDIDSTPEELDTYCKECDFVFNLAGVNRPQDPKEFMEGNFGFASTLLNTLKKYNNNCPVMISSSIQAELDNPYGESKRAGEQLMFDYSAETGAKVLVYRFPNLFGKWCRPNYNSAVATFCNNIANDLPIQVNDPSVMLNLCYIDDVVDELIAAAAGKEHIDGKFCYVPTVHRVKLGEIVELLNKFKSMNETLAVPMLSNAFEKALHATYLSYLPKEKFAYAVKMNIDARGSYTELIRSEHHGQFAVNISKPGITKGQHWHHTKIEKFIVVHGHGLIQQRKHGSDEVINFEVSGDNIQVIETIPGYTHNIINLSQTEDLVTIIWCNENFDPARPDTYGEPV